MAKTHTSEKLPKDIYAILLSLHTVLIKKAVWFLRIFYIEYAIQTADYCPYSSANIGVNLLHHTSQSSYNQKS